MKWNWISLKKGYGTDIFAECTVVFEHKGKPYARHIVQPVAGYEQVQSIDIIIIPDDIVIEHEPQCKHQPGTGGKVRVPEPFPFSRPPSIPFFVRQHIQDHHGPASPAAPAPVQYDGTDDLGDQVMGNGPA